jgi:IKI3 family
MTPVMHPFVLLELRQSRQVRWEKGIVCLAGRVVALQWSGDSEYLAMLIDQSEGVMRHLQKMQLWIRRNWKWYLKLERHFDDDEVPSWSLVMYLACGIDFLLALI